MLSPYIGYIRRPLCLLPIGCCWKRICHSLNRQDFIICSFKFLVTKLYALGCFPKDINQIIQPPQSNESNPILYFLICIKKQWNIQSVVTSVRTHTAKTKTTFSEFDKSKIINCSSHRTISVDDKGTQQGPRVTNVDLTEQTSQLPVGTTVDQRLQVFHLWFCQFVPSNQRTFNNSVINKIFVQTWTSVQPCKKKISYFQQ